MLIRFSQYLPRPLAYVALAATYALLIVSIFLSLGFPLPDILYVDIPVARFQP